MQAVCVLCAAAAVAVTIMQLLLWMWGYMSCYHARHIDSAAPQPTIPSTTPLPATCPACPAAAGYNGYNTRWALQLLDRVFPNNTAAPPPRLVTIFFGANDAALPDRGS